MQKSFTSATKLATALLLSVALLFNLSLTGVNAADAHVDRAEEYAVFLQDKYDLNVASSLTKGDFISYVATVLDLAAPADNVAFSDLAANDKLYSSAAALYSEGMLSGPAIGANEPLKSWVAVLIALRASNLQELAFTYPQNKVDAALQKLGASSKHFNSTTAQELAAAVDTGLIPAEYYEEVAAKGVASAELVNVLLGKVLSFNGEYKQYIGYVSDADIYSKLADAYKTSNIIQIPQLQEFVDSALKQDVVTGYNLKDSRFDANFVDALTLTYGHSSVQHVNQLIGLLRSEGIDAKVQLEPKTSAFVHRKEWGEPNIDENNQAVLTENGNYINYSKEYDLKLEFNTVTDKDKFQQIILQYAKKDSSDQTGLIIGSWFQPLFYSLDKVDGFEQIANSKIEDGYYYVQTFSLVNDVDKIAEGFANIDPKVDVESYTFWTNEAFFNYLNGEGL